MTEADLVIRGSSGEQARVSVSDIVTSDDLQAPVAGDAQFGDEVIDAIEERFEDMDGVTVSVRS